MRRRFERGFALVLALEMIFKFLGLLQVWRGWDNGDEVTVRSNRHQCRIMGNMAVSNMEVDS